MIQLFFISLKLCCREQEVVSHYYYFILEGKLKAFNVLILKMSLLELKFKFAFPS